MVVTQSRAPKRGEDKTMLWLRSPPLTTPGGRRKGETCREHGRLQRLDPEAFTFEKDGLTWRIEPKYAAADLMFCPECVEDRYRDYDRADDSMEELVGLAIRGNWSEFWSYFTPESVAELGDFEACPFCGAEPTRTADSELTCPDHGPLRVEVERRG